MAKCLIVPADLHAKLRHISIDRDMELREIAVEAVRDWIKKQEEQKDKETVPA